MSLIIRFDNKLRGFRVPNTLGLGQQAARELGEREMGGDGRALGCEMDGCPINVHMFEDWEGSLESSCQGELAW